MKESRRYRRIRRSGSIQISWIERGEPRYIRGKYVDVSQGGVRLEIPVPIPAGVVVQLRSESIKISGSARVRHVSRFGARHVIGIELLRPLHGGALDFIEERIDQRAPIANLVLPAIGPRCDPGIMASTAALYGEACTPEFSNLQSP